MASMHHMNFKFTNFEVGAVVINTRLDFNIYKRFGKKMKRA